MGRAKGATVAVGEVRASRRHYTEETLRIELECFTSDRDDWPTYNEMRAAGRPDLAWAVRVNGGPRRWAAELGKRLHAKTRRQRDWTDEVIEAQLRAFLADADFFPGAREFTAAGRYELYMAARRYGGIEHWRSRLRLPASKRVRWTDAELEAELREFVGDRPDWPSEAEFRRAGREDLIRAVQSRSGGAWWAHRLGKKLSPRQQAHLPRVAM